MKIHKLYTPDKKQHRLAFHCPGCTFTHSVDDSWTFNESYESPTFTPSILVQSYRYDPKKPFVCHSYVTDGQIQFLTDSTHKLAGKTVAIPDWDE